MSFLLDTNTISAHLRRPAGLAHRFIQHSGRLFTSTVCLAELYVWAFRRPDPQPLLDSIEELLVDEVQLLGFDRDAALLFGDVRIQLRKRGIEVNTTDLMIASVALVHDHTLVTHNTADFQNIPGLRLDDWVT